MTDGDRRLNVLCEDRLTERFIGRLCDRYHIRVVRVEAAPDGKGSASAWVLNRYPLLVRKRRSKNFQQNLGLLVAIDGDRHGALYWFSVNATSG